MPHQHLLVIGNLWPERSNGYQYAIEASLQLYLSLFERATYLCLAETPQPGSLPTNLEGIVWRMSRHDKLPKWRRFLNSMSSPLPAVATLKIDKNAFRKAVREAKQHADSDGMPLAVIVEGTPFLPTIGLVRDIIRKGQVAVHAHEVLTDSFSGMDRQSSFLGSFAWKLELSKIRSLEQNTNKFCSTLLTISEADSDLFSSIHDVKSDGVIGVSFPEDFQSGTQPGDPKTLLFLGTADLRKGIGLRQFIEQGWPHVRAEIPDAKLILGGTNTEHFDNPKQGIEGVGFISEQEEFLSRGRLFLNPQKIGGGVKIKTLVALFAGKAILSTHNGVLGIEGENGVHFIVSDDFRKLAKHTVELMRDPSKADSIADEGKKQALKTYSQTAFNNRYAPVVEEFMRRVEQSA